MRGYDVIDDPGHVPIKTWTRGVPIEDAALKQLKNVASLPFIHLARTSSVRQHVEAAIAPLQMNTVMELEQLSTVAGMVRAGLGVTVVPMLTLFHFDHAELVTRPLRAPNLVRQLFLIRPRDQRLSIAAQALHGWLVAHKPRTDVR